MSQPLVSALPVWSGDSAFQLFGCLAAQFFKYRQHGTSFLRRQLRQDSGNSSHLPLALEGLLTLVGQSNPGHVLPLGIPFSDYKPLLLHAN